MALFSLRANRLRTVLTTVGIGIGVATLLAIIGIIQGLNTSFANQMATIGSSSLYVSKFPWVIKGDWWQYRTRRDFPLEQMAVIRAQSTFATAVAPVVFRVADVGFLSDQLSLVGVLGTRGDYLAVTGWELSSGRFLNETDEDNRRSVVVLGVDVVDRLFPNSDPLGASVRIENRPFRVIGVLARRGKILGESQDLRVMIPFKTFWAYFGKRRGFSIGVGIGRSQDIDAAEDQLVGILRRARNTPADRPDDFTINRPEQLAATYRQLTGALYSVAIGIGMITMLVGGIGIMNIMLVSVRERTREIGIRRALGARKRTIVLQFLMEAAAVSGIGGLLGTIVGLSGAKLVSEITPLAAAVDPLTVVLGVSFAAIVGLLFGIWPAARAANLDPVEALRYE